MWRLSPVSRASTPTATPPRSVVAGPIPAVAFAVALDADVCEIYTDVDGIFTADPRIVPTAKRIPSIDYDSILEMAACGSKVLALRCVEYAQRFKHAVACASVLLPQAGHAGRAEWWTRARCRISTSQRNPHPNRSEGKRT